MEYFKKIPKHYPTAKLPNQIIDIIIVFIFPKTKCKSVLSLIY